MSEIVTHASIFSGIGGNDLAAECMGWKNVFHCELIDNKRKWLSHRWPGSKSYADITKTDFTIHRRKVDILTGGDPCQVSSKIGKREGMGGYYTYGHNFSGPFEKLNQLHWLMKMWTEQFLMEYSTKRSLTWKASVTPAGHPLLSLRVSLVPHTEETGFGWLPTPLKDDWKGGSSAPRKDNGKLRLDQLRHWWKIKTGLSVPAPSFLRVMMGFPDGWMRYRDTEMQ